MSAFLVSDAHINALLSYASRSGHGAAMRTHLHAGSLGLVDVREPGQLDRRAGVLKQQNIRSLLARYQNDKPDDFDYRITFRRRVADLSPVECLSACACYDYQACETDDYKDTDAAEIVDSIRHQA